MKRIAALIAAIAFVLLSVKTVALYAPESYAPLALFWGAITVALWTAAVIALWHAVRRSRWAI